MSYRKPGVVTKKVNQPASGGVAGVFVNIGMIGVGDGGVSSQAKSVVRGAGSLTDFVDVYMSDAVVQYRGVAYQKDVDFSVSSGSIVWAATKITVPYLKRVVTVAAQGSLPSATYYYAITAIKKVTVNTYGETTISNAASITLGVAGKVVLNWSQIDLADGYRIYRGTSASNMKLIRELDGAGSTIWEDTGLYTPSAVAFPVVNTAYKRPPSSIADTVGYFTGVDASANIAGLLAVNDGSLTINADGRGAIEVKDIDLSGGVDLAGCAALIQTAARQALGDRGLFVSASAENNLENLKSITDGKFDIALDGGSKETVEVNLSTATSFETVATLIQVAVRAATTPANLATVEYNAELGLFYIYSATRGTSSSVKIEAASTGTDLTGATYLNFVNGAQVDGTAYAVLVEYDAVSSSFIVTSATAGEDSSIAVTAGVTGTNLIVAELLALVSGTATVGTTGETVLYDVLATISGVNFFVPETFFGLNDVGFAHGFASEIYGVSSKIMSPVPVGFNAPQLTLVGVPEMSRSAVAGALEEMSKVDVDVVCATTNDIDIARDIVAHCVACSQDEVKKERVAIVSLDSTKVTYNVFVSLATEFSVYGDRVVLVYDNFTTEPYIAPLVAACQASREDRATSMINVPFITQLPVLKTGRLNGNAETVLLSQGVMVLGKSEEGVLSIIDDICCGGPDTAITDRLVEDMLRKNIRKAVAVQKGKKKLDSLADAIENTAVNLLDKAVTDEVITEWVPAYLKVENHPSNPKGYVLRFRYVTMKTLKIVDVEYTVDYN